MSNDTSNNIIEKIKANISLYDDSILKKDLEKFDIKNITNLCNRLISYYRGKKFIKIEKDLFKTNSKTLNIRIQQHHIDCIYSDIKNFCKDEKNISYADYMRYLIYNYLNNSPINREKILNEEKFEFIERVIDENKILQKNKSSTKILPIAIIEYEPEGRSYLLNFYIEKKEFKCLQIKNFTITDYTKIDEQTTLTYKELRLANNLKENFDPFLTFDHTVKVKFTENGKTSYEKTVHNKPKLVKIDENGNYIFQCTEFLGKLYFGQFLDNVEILEPENLRTYFKEKSQKMYNLYNKKNKE